LLRDLAKTPQERDVLDFMSQAVSVGAAGRHHARRAGGCLAALRAAFDATLRDPPSWPRSRSKRLELRRWTAAARRSRQAVIETPANVREKVKLAIQPRNANDAAGAKPAE